MELNMIVDMKMEMNERLSLAEEKLAKTEAELAINKGELAATKDALAKAIIDQTATRNYLAITKADLMSKTDKLERELVILRAPPFIHVCGSHYERIAGSSGHSISYTSLLYSSTNTEGGGLDITTGVFTAPHGGSYTVSWDAQARLNRWEGVSIYLQKNGATIEESLHNSYYGDNIDDHMNEQGGRTLVVHLDQGETLQLYKASGDQSGDIAKTTFCVSLTTFDIE